MYPHQPYSSQPAQPVYPQQWQQQQHQQQQQPRNTMSSPSSIPSSIPPRGVPTPFGSVGQQPQQPQNISPNTSLGAQKPAKVEPVKLYTSNREREMYDNMADLYSIIKTTEALEKAYVRDTITADDYKKNCAKLITQFKAAQNLTKDSVPDIKKFMHDYRLDCKAAEKRLLEEGVPLSGGKHDDTARTVAETVQFFITTMDSLKLNMSAVDQLHPLLSDLLESLSKISSLPPDWEGKLKIKNWLVQMNKMKASDELDNDQIRQLLFDLESAYTAFHKSLSHK